jgi:DNA invertase Pin-like site-specific DNA recombinase
MQRDAIEKYCVEKKLTTPQFVEEVASAAKPIWVVNLPGTPLDQTVTQSSPRPRFMLLINHLKRVREAIGGTEKAHLIVWKLDRLARVDYEQELFLTMFRQDHVVLHSVMPTEDHMLDGGHVHDPARAFTRTVIAAAAAYERAMIEMRMSAGLVYKASQGGYTGGVPPFGYVARKGELAIDPYEAKMVCFIYHLRMRYKMSLNSIERYITEHKHADDKNRYDHAKIGRILKDNEQLYRGLYVDRYGSPHPRPDLKILPDDPEALLDYGTETQSQRTESVGLSGENRNGSPEQAGGQGGDLGPGSALSGQEPDRNGMPTDPSSVVPALGV